MNGKVQVQPLKSELLVHTVEGSVARVQLDGGEDSLPGGGSRSNRDSASSIGHGSRGNDLRGGVGNVSHEGGSGQRGDEAVGVGQGKAGGNNLGRAPLPLSRG